MGRRLLLTCGILSSVLFAAMNVFVPMQWPEYHSASQTVSELSAIGAPTRAIWVVLGSLYSLLLALFGWGVRRSARQARSLTVAGSLIVVYGLISLGWPPMHQREVLAAGGKTLTDTLHIAWTAITGVLMLAAIGFAAAARGTTFRRYSVATVVVMIACAALTSLDAPELEANLPTPWMGLWERLNVGAMVVWIAALAVALLGRQETATDGTGARLGSAT